MNRKTIVLLIAAVALLAPTLLFAQDELTLESLRDRLVDLEARIVNLEALFADPWSPNAINTDDGICQNPLHAQDERSNFIKMEIRQETADAYRSAYGVSINPDDVYLSSISFGVSSNHVYLEYTSRDDKRRVVEKWAHCEFLGHSKWRR